MPEISIIIVNYNSGNCIANCVTSILNNIKVPFEVIVWDNGSTDDSITKLRLILSAQAAVTVVESGENPGFARANNKAFELAKGRICHFLNPDTLVDHELNAAYEAILNESNPNTCWVTRIKNEHGQYEQTSSSIPLLRDLYHQLIRSGKARKWHIGASVIIPSETFTKIGRWNEIYFMYTEDMNLYYEMHRHNISIVELKESVIHIGKVSSGNSWSYNQRALKIERSLKAFYVHYNMLWQYYLIRPLQLTYVLFKNTREFKPSAMSFFRLFFKIRGLKL